MLERKRVKLILAAMLAAFCLGGCGQADSTQTQQMEAEKNNYSDETELISEKEEYKEFVNQTEAYLEKCEFQGTILVARDDEVIFAKGYGPSDEKNPQGEQNTIHSTFEIGSITKQMTAASILQLQEEGLLSVTDTLDQYFPDFPYANQITLDQMLHMRSGLKDHINDPESFFPKEIADQLIEDEENCIPVEDGIVLQYLNQKTLRFKPDERFDYNNTNYYLLAEIIEQVSGQKYDDYIKEHIFNVCDMAESNLDFQGTTTKGYDGAGRYYSIPKSLAKGCGEINASVLHGGSTDVFNSYNSIYSGDGLYVIVLINKPIEDFSSTTIAGNIRKFWTGGL